MRGGGGEWGGVGDVDVMGWVEIVSLHGIIAIGLRCLPGTWEVR